MQALHAGDFNGVTARAAHMTAHGIDEVLQINDFRLPGGVVDGGHAVQKHGGHHHIFRRAHAGVVEIHVPGTHAGAVAVDQPALLRHHHAQAAQAAQMQVNGPQTDLAASGICNRGLAEAGQNGAQEKDGRANLLGESVGHLPLAEIAAVHRQRPAAARDPAAENFEDFRHVGRVRDLRHIVQGHLVLRED